MAAVTLEFESKTIRKIQKRLLPFVFLCYSVALLDRANIGFAALTMNKDLGISAQMYGLLTGTFFMGYVLFEIPSNVLLHKLGARIWIARVLITWGIVAACTGFAHSVTQICIIRFLLGVAEAGFFPGMILYNTYWFRQREQAQGLAFFMAAQPFFALVGAPISGVILDYVHWLGVASWRWLLILEAVPAILMGVMVYFVLPNRPADAKFLSAEEKNWLIAELKREEASAVNRTGHSSAIKALANPLVWYLAIIDLIFTNATVWMNFWMPSLVKVLSKSRSNTFVGLLVAVPMVFGLVVMLIMSHHSDRTQERRFHIAIPNLLGGIGLLVVFAGKGTHPLYLSIAMLTLMVVAIDNFYGCFWSLPSTFLTGYAAASGIALISSFANISGFVGPWIIGYVNGKTGSLYLGAGLIGMCLIASALLTVLLPKKRQGCAPGQ